MGTTHNFDNPAASAVASGDTFPMIDATTGRGKTATVAMAISAVRAVVATAATTLTVTQALHGNRTILLSNATPIIVTLPQATGTGTKYSFVIDVAATATESTIKVANATDVMRGYVFAVTTSTDNAEGFKTSASSDSIQLNGTTKGGVAGDVIEITDVKTGIFSVMAFTAPTGTEVTPFSAAVS